MRSSRRSAIAALTTVALVASIGRPAWADCKNDADCKGDRVCERGKCVTPTAPSSEAAPPVAPAPAPPPAPPPPAAQVAPAGSSATGAGFPSNQPGSVPVQFGGKDGQLITIEGPSGRGSCRMPCTVSLLPGRYSVHTKAAHDEVDIPNAPSTVEVKGSSWAYYFGGTLLVTHGVPLLAFGIWAASLGANDSGTFGVGFSVPGVLMTGAGIALIVVGATRGAGKAFVTSDAPRTAGSIITDSRGVGIVF